MTESLKIHRFSANPLIHSDLGESIGANINGPSLIKVPAFVKNPLGKYYLYFAHHQGRFIRMAYADSPEGPYTLYEPGVLHLEDTPFSHHIASPDVHIDFEKQRIFMIYHGAGFDRTPNTTEFNQISCYADGNDGLSFDTRPDFLAPSYLRIFYYRGFWYGCDGGPHRIWRRSPKPEGPYETGKEFTIPEEAYPPRDGRNDLDKRRMRHLAFDTAYLAEDRLDVYYSNVGDAPERIRRVTVDLSGDWLSWHGRHLTEAARPETELEGANLPVEASANGAKHERVHQLRDPYVYHGSEGTILLYSYAGESGLNGAYILNPTM